MLKDLGVAATAAAMLSTLLGGLPAGVHHATLLGSNLDIVLAWFLAIVIAVSIGIPGTVIAASLASGAVFGPWVGMGLVAAGALLGSIVSFALTRKLARRSVASRFPRHLDRVQSGFSKGGIWFLVTARLLGVPFMLVNLCFALTKIRYPAFAFGSLVGSLPIIALYSGAGASLRSPAPAMLALLPACALALILLRYLVRRRPRTA